MSRRSRQSAQCCADPVSKPVVWIRQDMTVVTNFFGGFFSIRHRRKCYQVIDARLESGACDERTCRKAIESVGSRQPLAMGPMPPALGCLARWWDRPPCVSDRVSLSLRIGRETRILHQPLDSLRLVRVVRQGLENWMRPRVAADQNTNDLAWGGWPDRARILLSKSPRCRLYSALFVTFHFGGTAGSESGLSIRTILSPSTGPRDPQSETSEAARRLTRRLAPKMSC